jgi:hypothetical protein
VDSFPAQSPDEVHRAGSVAATLSASDRLNRRTMYYDNDSTAAAAASLPIILVSLVLAIVTLVALWKVFTKAGERGWASIVPFYNTYVEFRIAGYNPWLFLLLLIPIVNIVMLILVQVRTGTAFGKNVIWSIFLMVLFPTIGLLILGFGNASYDRSRIA